MRRLLAAIAIAAACAVAALVALQPASSTRPEVSAHSALVAAIYKVLHEPGAMLLNGKVDFEWDARGNAETGAGMVGWRQVDGTMYFRDSSQSPEWTSSRAPRHSIQPLPLTWGLKCLLTSRHVTRISGGFELGPYSQANQMLTGCTGQEFVVLVRNGRITTEIMRVNRLETDRYDFVQVRHPLVLTPPPRSQTRPYSKTRL